jgi:hypothetical protein
MAERAARFFESGRRESAENVVGELWGGLRPTQTQQEVIIFIRKVSLLQGPKCIFLNLGGRCPRIHHRYPFKVLQSIVARIGAHKCVRSVFLAQRLEAPLAEINGGTTGGRARTGGWSFDLRRPPVYPRSN